MPVQTVTAKINKEELGAVLPHEHIFLDLSVFYVPRVKDGHLLTDNVSIENIGMLNRDPYALKDNLIIDNYGEQLSEILRTKPFGVKTIVDATNIGIGRDPEKLKRISLDSGINIVMGAGYYVGNDKRSEVVKLTTKELAAKIADEVTTGADDTGIKAGVIGEIGVSEYFGDYERKLLRASAMAQKSTGAGMLIHINPWTTLGIDALDEIKEYHLDPKKICVCHVDVENRKDYIRALLDRGVYIEFDNFGKEYYIDKEVRGRGYGLFAKDTERVELLKELTDEGYAPQILLSNDVCLKILLRRYGGWGYDHLLRNCVPMMREYGIGDADIQTMICKNPADFLDIAA